MFELPSDHTIEKVIITKECVLGNECPKYIKNEARQPKQLTAGTQDKKRKTTSKTIA